MCTESSKVTSLPLAKSVVSHTLLVHHVARRLKLSCRVVRYLARRGKLPGFKSGVKIWRFLVADVEEFQARRETSDV
jgi:Helix-turn-helix domain